MIQQHKKIVFFLLVICPFLLLACFPASGQDEHYMQRTEAGTSIGFSPLPLIHNALRLEWEERLKWKNTRLLVAPMLYLGRTQSYTDSRNNNLRFAADLPSTLLFRNDRVSGFGTEVGLKRSFFRPFRPFLRPEWYLMVSLSAHRIALQYEDAVWQAREENGATYLSPALVRFKDKISRLDLSLSVGQKVVINHVSIDGFAGVSWRMNHTERSAVERNRFHNLADWFDHAYRGLALRAGFVIGYCRHYRKEK